MLFKSMLIALLGLFLTGCAVYGGGYGHRGYDRHYSSTYYQVHRQPVYVVPRYQRHDGHRYYDGRRHDDRHDGRHDGRRYDDGRHSQHRYIPVPVPRHYQSNGHKLRHDYRAVQPQAGWDRRREQRQEDWGSRRQEIRQQGHNARQDDRRRGDGQRDGERRGWERQQN